MLMRISPRTTLAQIFHMICSEKNLDPYKYELRHPTKPNEALNMANALSNYAINAINIVNIAGESYLFLYTVTPQYNAPRYNADRL